MVTLELRGSSRPACRAVSTPTWKRRWGAPIRSSPRAPCFRQPTSTRCSHRRRHCPTTCTTSSVTGLHVAVDHALSGQRRNAEWEIAALHRNGTESAAHRRSSLGERWISGRFDFAWNEVRIRSRRFDGAPRRRESQPRRRFRAARWDEPARERAFGVRRRQRAPGHVIVVAAGNSGGLYVVNGIKPLGIHTKVHVDDHEPVSVPVISPGATSGKVYVWITFRTGDVVSVGLHGPDGSRWLAPVDPGHDAGHDESNGANGSIINDEVNGLSSLTSDTNGAVVAWSRICAEPRARSRSISSVMGTRNSGPKQRERQRPKAPTSSAARSKAPWRRQRRRRRSSRSVAP